MIVQWLAIASIAGYVALLAVGHLALGKAIYQCLRREPVEGRRQRQPATMTAGDTPLRAQAG